MRESHADGHRPASFLLPFLNPLIGVRSRRWFLQAGMAGLGGLAFPSLSKGESAKTATPKSVILFWLSGGPSQLDMWDPKPLAPTEIRGPFGTIPTALPGVAFCEHLPLQASLADKLSIIRSVDCSASNHTPITMQAGNPLAKRTNDGKDGGGFPSMGSIAARYRGANDPHMPAFVGLAESWEADVYGAGNLGQSYEPVKGLELSGKFKIPEGMAISRLEDRNEIRRRFDHLRARLDQTGQMERFDIQTQRASEMVLSGKVERAFDISQENAETRERYGRESVGQKALLARRLVEAGSSFVLVSGAWGYFDHHGDNVRWGGIEKGLKPLLPQIDQALYALISDLEQRGLLDDTLVLMMGEFGRSPVVNKEAGRDHWTNTMSMLMAGGGLSHGQVVGGTDRRGGEIVSSPVRPQDLAATVFRHLEIPLGTHWTDPSGRPIGIVVDGGRPIPELA